MVEAVSETIPDASHRFCARHLYNNFRAKFPGLLLRFDFWNAVKAYDQVFFEDAMKRMKEHNAEAHAHMMKIPLSMWARHSFYPEARSDHITNNMCESFNQWVGKFRSKPILGLLENMRLKMMSRLQKRYAKGCTWEGRITPYARSRLDKTIQTSRTCKLIPASKQEFQVLEGARKFAVDLSKRSCTCGEWEISGMPCKHAVLCVGYTRGNLEELCDDCYTVAKYLKAYSSVIHPLPDSNLDPRNDDENLQPPPLKRLPGRPKKNRRREEDEAAKRKRSTTVRCDNCKGFGHNRRTCQRAPVAKKVPTLFS